MKVLPSSDRRWSVALDEASRGIEDSMKSGPPPKSANDYLARLPANHRAALEKLRAQIKAAAPDAEEVISYGQPTFKLHGHLVAIGAFRNHLSFFPMSSTAIAEHAAILKGYETSKGTIQFTPEKPIPAAVVKKIVKARIAQNLEVADEHARRKAAKPAPRKKAKRQ
jgi:uncharacterized protein YdhG (YjbR/CyaY superfamily)